MFFLLPPVTAVLVVALGLVLAWRAWRQRHAPRRATRRRRGRLSGVVSVLVTSLVRSVVAGWLQGRSGKSGPAG